MTEMHNEPLRLNKDKANGFIALIDLLWSINAFLISKRQCLKPLTLSAVRNNDSMLRSKFFVVCKCPGDKTLFTAKCPTPRDSTCIRCLGLARGMLSAGIDSHIKSSNQCSLNLPRKITKKTLSDLVFQVAAPRIRNSLPATLRDIDCFQDFNRHFYKSLFI